MDDSSTLCLPYGIPDIRSPLALNKVTGNIRCPVRGCEHWVRPPTRALAGTACPEHGIYVHRSSTYTYQDYRRNLLDPAYFARHIRHHPFKYEAHRFGQERSEDALTYNVFRSLQQAGCLKDIAQLCTGVRVEKEPKLFLWGLELQDGGVEPWDLLIAARERFESDLPVNRPKTEPDIALFLPGHYLILIEAKFCSPNSFYQRDRKTKLFDLTLDQMLNIYQDKSLQILDYAEAHGRERIHHQLWRNVTFAEWMALKDSPRTKAFHVNLVRQGCEEEVCGEFLSLIRLEYRDRFEQIAWEQLYGIAKKRERHLLCRYLETKTAGLKPAFLISSGEPIRTRGDEPWLTSPRRRSR